jgi:hypothetical protein
MPDWPTPVHYEVLGPGTADNVTIDDGPLRTFHNVALHCTTESRVPANIDLLQVHTSGTTPPASGAASTQRNLRRLQPQR